jgi:hypothetical protein
MMIQDYYVKKVIHYIEVKEKQAEACLACHLISDKANILTAV